MRRLTKREAPESESGGKFLKFKSGESKNVLLLGDIYEFHQIFDDKERKSRLVSPNTKGAKPRFRINVAVNEDGEMKVKIFEFGLQIYNQLAALQEDYDLSTTVLKVSRQGERLDTEWLLLPLPPKAQPTEAQLAKIKAMDLHILEHKDAPVFEDVSQAADELEF